MAFKNKRFWQITSKKDWETFNLFMAPLSEKGRINIVIMIIRSYDALMYLAQLV